MRRMVDGAALRTVVPMFPTAGAVELTATGTKPVARGPVIGVAGAPTLSDQVAYDAAYTMAKRLHGTRVALLDCVPGSVDIAIMAATFRPHIGDAGPCTPVEELVIPDRRHGIDVVNSEPPGVEEPTPVGRYLKVLDQLRSSHGAVVCHLGALRSEDSRRFAALAAAVEAVMVCTPTDDRDALAAGCAVVDQLNASGVPVRVLPIETHEGGESPHFEAATFQCPVLPTVGDTAVWRAARNDSAGAVGHDTAALEEQLAVALFGVTGDGRLLGSAMWRSTRRSR